MIAPERLQVHGRTARTGEPIEFLTDDIQWSYAVSFDIEVPEAAANLQPLLAVDVHVAEGSVGVGVLDPGWRHYLTSETDIVASSKPVRIEVRLDTSDAPLHVMIRNTAPGGTASRFRLISASVTDVPREGLLLTAKSPLEPDVEVYAPPATSLTLDFYISHTSRRWFPEQCDRSYLRSRYSAPGRLTDPPPFESLPPNKAPYHGLLTILRLELTPARVGSRILRHYGSPEKIVHAAAVGPAIVVCFDAGIAVARHEEDANCAAPDPFTAERIVDPWFGGLHTVVDVDGRTCLVSSSGADAILWLDVGNRRVVRRWRLPADRYGANYALDDAMWLSEHYINNDLQLGHLNCAAPDGRGGALFSTLAQGDIGRLNADGTCDILATGYVGCHGVRFSPERRWIYFCDSCSGRLMRLDGAGGAVLLFETGSRWLHDAVHLAGGLFLLSMPDRNQLLLADVDAGRIIATWNFEPAMGTVQFLSLTTPRRLSAR